MPTYTWDHIHLRTADPEATVKWFESMLGAQMHPQHAARQAAHRHETRRRQYLHRAGGARRRVSTPRP